MVKELFINKNPLISGYSFYGGLFSVLPNNELIMPWIYANFIQLKYLVYHHIVFFDRYRSLLEGCPFFNHYVLKKSMMSEEGEESLINTLKSKIDNGSYCFLYIDRFYIPFYKIWFQKVHYNHEILVYGYDDDKEEFLCADNGDNGVYSYFTCLYSELSEGYWKNQNTDPYYFSLHYLENMIIPDKPYMLNFNLVKNSLKNYLYSKPMINETEEVITSTYGFIIHYNVLENQRELVKNIENVIDYRQVYILIDHKKIMVKRIKFLEDSGYLKNEDFDEQYQYLVDKYRLLLSLSMKYNLSKETELLDYYFELFENLIECEKNVLERLVCNLN